MSKDNPRWITIQDANSQSGINERTIRDRCKRGEYPSTGKGRGLFVDGDSLPVVSHVATPVANVTDNVPKSELTELQLKEQNFGLRKIIADKETAMIEAERLLAVKRGERDTPEQLRQRETNIINQEIELNKQRESLRIAQELADNTNNKIKAIEQLQRDVIARNESVITDINDSRRKLKVLEDVFIEVARREFKNKIHNSHGSKPMLGTTYKPMNINDMDDVAVMAYLINRYWKGEPLDYWKVGTVLNKQLKHEIINFNFSDNTDLITIPESDSRYADG